MDEKLPQPVDELNMNVGFLSGGFREREGAKPILCKFSIVILIFLYFWTKF